MYQAKYTDSSVAERFSSFDGALYKNDPDFTRKWGKKVRHIYNRWFWVIDSIAKFKSCLRHGPYIFPGGHETYFAFGDGRPCCHACALKEYEQIVSDTVNGFGFSFQIQSSHVNWDDLDLVCDLCGERIAPQYED